MDGWMDNCFNEEMVHMDKWVDGWVHGWGMNGVVDKWVDR